MRLLYFSDSYGPHDHRFLNLAAESGHKVYYLRRRSGPEGEARPLPRGIQRLAPLEPSPPKRRRYAASLFTPLRECLEDLKIDVVHAGPVQACAWLVAKAGFPRLLTMSWGSDLLVGARFGLGRWLAKAALQRSAAFLGDCRAVLDRAEELGMDRSRSVEIPWGVDLQAFHPSVSRATRGQLGWDDKLVAICVRSWEPGYGVNTVLEGFLSAAAAAPRLRLILGGDGSLRPKVLSRVRESGMADRIWLPGHIAYRDLPRFYRSADVYLSASVSDGSSVSLLEAMACGLPAFVTDIPGNREWVEPGQSGEWFAVRDAAGLATRLVEAARSPKELIPLGIRGRAIAEARADWRRNSAQVAVAYNLAMEGHEVRG